MQIEKALINDLINDRLLVKKIILKISHLKDITLQ